MNPHDVLLVIPVKVLPLMHGPAGHIKAVLRGLDPRIHVLVPGDDSAALRFRFHS